MPKFKERINSRRLNQLIRMYKHLNLEIIPVKDRYLYIIKLIMNGKTYIYNDLRFKDIRQICDKGYKLCAIVVDGDQSKIN